MPIHHRIAISPLFRLILITGLILVAGCGPAGLAAAPPTQGPDLVAAAGTSVGTEPSGSKITPSSVDEVEKLRSAAGSATVFEVGDCVRGADVYKAVNGGFMAAMEIV